MFEEDIVGLVKASRVKRVGAQSVEEALACEELFRMYDPIIQARIRRILHDRINGADDVAQDVWVLVIKKIGTWVCDPALGSLHGWIASIASHEAWKHARRRAVTQEQAVDFSLLAELLASRTDELSDVERGEQQEEACVVLAELEARLPALTGRIFRLRFFDAKSIPQIAAELGRSNDCVEMRLRHARNLLEEILRRRASGKTHGDFKKITFSEKKLDPF
jgi:RNA polymerase sigma factor (sigma-70 family)